VMTRRLIVTLASGMRMKRAIAVVLATAAALALAASPTQARTRHYATNITHDGSVQLRGDRYIDTGRVGSSQRFCERHRKVELTGYFADGTPSIQDLDWTSIDGAWAAKTNYLNFVRMKAKALKKRHRAPNGHRRVCDPAVVFWRTP
jgi:hypothetical protein